MLKILCNDYYREVLAFAEKENRLANLCERLESLHWYGNIGHPEIEEAKEAQLKVGGFYYPVPGIGLHLVGGDERKYFISGSSNTVSNYGSQEFRIDLGKDFAPYSFTVVWYRYLVNEDWKYFMNGGMIFHGAHDNGGATGGPPTFSVNVTPVDGWAIHT